MSKISEAKKLGDEIKNHSHYNLCLRGYLWSDYLRSRDKLDSISSTYSDILTEKKNLICEKNYLTQKEVEYNRYTENKSNEYENMKKKYYNEIVMKRKQKENILDNLKSDIRYEESREYNEINSINQEINFLSQELDLLNANYEREIETQKKNERELISIEYSNKINEYENMKKLDKRKFDIENEIKEKQFKADIEVEMNELENKAKLVNKLISMINKYS